MAGIVQSKLKVSITRIADNGSSDDSGSGQFLLLNLHFTVSPPRLVVIFPVTMAAGKSFLWQLGNFYCYLSDYSDV